MPEVLRRGPSEAVLVGDFCCSQPQGDIVIDL